MTTTAITTIMPTATYPIPARIEAIQRSFQQGFALLTEYLNIAPPSYRHADAGELVRSVLSGPYIAPFFAEYARDYLYASDEIEDISLASLQRWCRKKNAFKSRRFGYAGQGRALAASVDKAGWSALDHAARFVVQVLRFSWAHEGVWDRGAWDPESEDESELELWQVWLILRYLQAEWEAANVEEWSVDALEQVFGQLRLEKL